jgi:hypothetical protein
MGETGCQPCWSTRSSAARLCGKIMLMMRCWLTFFLMATLACAQWIHYPSKGIPRTPEGKPDLRAPAPKLTDGKPDIQGIWVRTPPAGTPPGPEFGNTADYYMAKGATIPYQPWALELRNQRRYRDLGGNRPSEHCLPHGVLGAMLPATPFKLFQTPGVVLLLYEQLNQFRQIFTDGRPFPRDPNPTWWGYSVGHYEDDAFVVESQGFNDLTWLDDSGTPHSTEMRAIERFRRTDFGHMTLDVTIDDPKAYTKPWMVTIPLQLMADTEMIEEVCDNEKAARHAVTSK